MPKWGGYISKKVQKRVFEHCSGTRRVGVSIGFSFRVGDIGRV